MDKEKLTGLIANGASIRQVAQMVGLSYTTVRYWLVKYDLKTDVKHRCSKCNETDPAKFTKGRFSECRKCRIKLQKDRYTKYKSRAVEYKGGKCRLCGYDKCFASLDFHHDNPLEKDPRWKTMRSWTFERIKAELDKCTLLCKNCHGEVHYGENDFGAKA